MKKMTFRMMLAVLIGLLPISISSAASVSVIANVDNKTGEVTIAGNWASSEGTEVTVLVKSPSGSIDYINQTTTGAEGAFLFRYFIEAGQSGVYKVAVSGTNAGTIHNTSFTYTAAVVKPTYPNGFIGPNSNVAVDQSFKAAQSGVIWSPDDSSIMKHIAEDGTVVSRVVLNSSIMNEALVRMREHSADASTLAIEVKETDNIMLELSSDAFLKAITEKEGIIISLHGLNIYYDLPLQLLKGHVEAGSTILLSIRTADQTINHLIAEQLGDAAVIGAIEFEVWVETNGVREAFNDFGHTYIHRGIVLQKAVDMKHATGVLFNPTTGELSFVPTVFHTDEGKSIAVIKRNGNSVYTVIEQKRTFADIERSWAKDDIEMLASKRIVNGKTDALFAPNDPISRAEFATLLVRALALQEGIAAQHYVDIESEEWYSKAIATAQQHGLLNGYSDGTFKPNEPIKREEIAVMLERALAYAGSNNNSLRSGEEQLARFKDHEDISDWAHDAVLTAIEMGLMNGTAPDLMSPKKLATRAEAVVMIKRLLQYSAFIN